MKLTFARKAKYIRRHNCLMCNSSPAGTLIIDGICFPCIKLLLTHGNHVQAQNLVNDFKAGQISRKKLETGLELCLPQPPDMEQKLTSFFKTLK